MKLKKIAKPVFAFSAVCWIGFAFIFLNFEAATSSLICAVAASVNLVGMVVASD